MADLPDIAAFVLARIAEDEVVAHEAAGGHWIPWEDDDPTAWLPIQNARGDDVAETRGDHPGAYAAHIARHDPARVLAWCAAIRAVIELHSPSEDRIGELSLGFYCACCRENYPCATVRLLAQPYADHVEFDPAWRV